MELIPNRVSLAFHFNFSRNAAPHPEQFTTKNGLQPLLSLLAAGFRLIYTLFLGAGLAMLTLQLICIETNDQTTIYLEGFLKIGSLGLIVFGIHLLLVGWLMVQAVFIPKPLAVLMILASICYMGNNTAQLLLPHHRPTLAVVDSVLSVPMAAAELGLAFWLLFKSRARV